MNDKDQMAERALAVLHTEDNAKRITHTIVVDGETVGAILTSGRSDWGVEIDAPSPHHIGYDCVPSLKTAKQMAREDIADLGWSEPDFLEVIANPRISKK